MPRTEVIRVIPKFHVDLSDLVEMESSGKFQDEKLDQPVMKKNGTTSEKPKDDKNIIIKSHLDVSENYLEWVKVLYSPDWADLLKNQLQSEHTPFALCVEILDKVKIVQNKKVLVISAIEFIAVLIDKLGIKKENIFFLDEGQKHATMDSIKREVIIEADMIPEQNILNINEVKKMKFDFVVGNPPWGANNNNGSTNGTKLYESIVSISVDVCKTGGVISMIIPSKFAITKNSKFAKMVHDVGIIEIHDFGKSRFANVNKACLNLLLHKGVNRNGKFKVISENGEVSERNEVFMCISNGGLTTTGKSFGDLWIRGKKKRSELIRTENGIVVVETVNGQDGPLLTATIDPKSECTGLGIWKVVINNFNNHDSIGPIKISPPDQAICFSVVGFPCESEEQAKNYVEYLKSDFVSELYRTIPKSTANSKTVFSFIPLP